jgi:hypothetical protein
VNKHIAYIGFAIAGLILSPIGYADDVTDDTMTVVDEGGTPTDVTKALPDVASDTADAQAAFGLGVAGQARDLGREFGQSIAEQARDAHDAAGGNAFSHRP